MNRREKVIVMAMVAAAAYGGYSLLWPSDPGRSVKTGPAGAGDKTLTTFVAEIVSKIKNLDPAGTDAYIITRGNLPWPANPFVQGQPVSEAQSTPGEHASAHDPARLRFSGFLQMGQSTLAIIDGTEYQQGDLVPDYGYRVKSISAARVVLQEADGKAEVILKLEDME